METHHALISMWKNASFALDNSIPSKNALSGARGVQLADAAEGLSAVADALGSGLIIVDCWRDFGAQKDRKSLKSVPHGTVEGGDVSIYRQIHVRRIVEKGKK